MTKHHYDNEVHPDNVYGHTLELLRRHVGETDRGATPGIHLDVACGFGNIAELVRDELGLEYVGLDYDQDELAALASRGFETHRTDLMAPDLGARLAEIVAGRPVRSVTFLDGLEHLVDGTGALRALAGLISAHDAVLVTSVPNVTHLDVATKAMLGRWDYTVSGLLDRTHYQLWSAGSLQKSFDAAGLAVIDHHDVELEHSDQHFPANHVALSSATSLGAWISSLRADVEPHRFTNQFVWASRAAATRPTLEEVEEVEEVESGSPDRPFISLLVRASGMRLEALDETLLSLAAQTVTDFEVVVLAGASGDELDAIRSHVAEHPTTLRERVIVVPTTGSTPEVLNAGLAVSRGTYVALSDDVTWLGHWVESARELAREFPGRCLRGLVLEQEVETVRIAGAPGVRAVSAPTRAGGSAFSHLEHLGAPFASPYGYAFPRSLHVDLGVRFDESFGTASVRRHLLRAVELAGVVDIEEVVAVHQRQAGAGRVETEDDLARLVDVIDSAPFMLPARTARRALNTPNPLSKDLDWAREELARREQLISLKDDHIANLEQSLRAGVEKADRLEGQLAKRRKQVERLRERVQAPDKKDAEPAKRPGRFRLRP